MMAPSSGNRRLRWLVPAVVAVSIALLGLLPTLSSAATPDLPSVSPEQLIAKVEQSDVHAFSGRVRLTPDLGIPNLGALGGDVGGSGTGFNPTSLLSGVHEADVKVAGPDRQRLAMAEGLSETDVYHDGRDVWTWASDGQKVTHLLLPAPGADAADNAAGNRPEPVVTPDELAKRLLENITPSTAVSVTTSQYVAGRAAYELALAPRSPDSTIDHLLIAVDAANGFPLLVGVVAKGDQKPAVELGFTSIDYGTPSGPFTFAPPPGATVTTKDLSNHDAGPGNEPAAGGDQTASSGRTTTVGADWTRVAIFKDVQLPPEAHELLRATTPVSNGRLLPSKLLNVIFLDDGRVVAGFVKPAMLEAAAAHG
jgi:outer membrane lipoprotein-sorting protein